MAPSPFSVFPDSLLDEVVASTFYLAPSLRIVFLSSLGTRIHDSAVRVLFSTVTVADDARIIDLLGITKSIVTPLLLNPTHYGEAVKTLGIRSPDLDSELFSLSTPNGDTTDSSHNFRPLDASAIASLLKACPNLEGLVWQSTIPPPDGLCEMLVSHTPRLTHFTFTPEHTAGPHSSTRASLAKWDALSLPLLASLPLVSLRLSRLSQSGTRALSQLFDNLGEYSTLEDVSVNFVWLDDLLCDKLVEAGRRIRRLTLGTNGTKLTDKGLLNILEKCDALEELVLDQVQGRLSRGLWSKATQYPSGLRKLRIVISETGPHHSWTTDHLHSLDSVPLESLLGFSFVRKEVLPTLENGAVVYQATVDEALAVNTVPKEFIERIKGSKTSLISFECDWWAWSIGDLKVVLESCPNLETMKLCLDAPFSKLLGLTSAFASLSNLHTMFISINNMHAPGTPPAPSLPFPQSSLPTPTESPVLKYKSLLPQLLDLDNMQYQSCPSGPASVDPSMPLLRDVKRFVRKLPRLSILEWYGKAGRGSWSVTRPSLSNIKTNINVSVEYSPPSISKAVWDAMLRSQGFEEASKRGWAPTGSDRVGHVWTGLAAETVAAELASQEKDDHSTVDRDGNKRVKSVSISGPYHRGAIDIPSTPTRSSHPISPPNSASSTSSILPVTESPSSSSSLPSIRREHDQKTLTHKRYPSEPGLRMSGTTRGRTRSATAGATKSTPDRSLGRIDTGSGRGRGSGSNSSRGRRKNPVFKGDEVQITTTARGRGGRRGMRSSGFYSGRKSLPQE